MPRLCSAFFGQPGVRESLSEIGWAQIVKFFTKFLRGKNHFANIPPT